MLEVPRDVEENKKFRAKLLQKADSDPEMRSMLVEKCKRDWKFFINAFCWTYDPRLSTPHVPFILYPRQEDLITFLEEKWERAKKGEEVAVVLDKPRDVGATFTAMTWGLWHFLFDEFSFRVGSRKEDYVDKKGDVDTLFFKIDYNLDRLPSWLLPEGFSRSKNRGAMMLMNPVNSNAITGESANPNFGRGGRKSAILFDELGFWDWARASWESSGESTNMRICMSTPPESGRDSFFYKLRKGEKGKVYIFNFEWNDVPGRTQDWLAEKKATKSEAEFAREIMKSYEGTTEGKVYANDLKYVTITENVDYDPQRPLYISWDFGLDAISMVWLQKDENGNIYVIDYYENYNKEIGFFVPFVTGETVSAPGFDYTEHDIEIINRHYYWSNNIEHFGDPSVKQRHNSTGKSTKDVLMDYNIFVQCKDWAGRKWTDLRDLTKPIFKRMTIHETRCEYLISCLRNARYPHRTGMSVSGGEKPIHDWTAHGRSALEFFADNEPGYIPAGHMAPPPMQEEASGDDFSHPYEKYYLF